MTVVLHGPTCLAKYIATWRLKQAGCEFPNPRVGPKRADTAASISASEIRRCETESGTKEGDAIYAPFAASASAG